MLLSVADRMSPALNAIQQDLKVSRAPGDAVHEPDTGLCGDAGDTITDGRETSPDLVQLPELGLFCQRAFSVWLTRCQGFVLCLLTENSQGTAFVQETKLILEPQGMVLPVMVDLELFLTHPQEPRSSYVSVGQGGFTMQDRN